VPDNNHCGVGACTLRAQAYRILGQGTTIINTTNVKAGLAYLDGFQLACGGNGGFGSGCGGSAATAEDTAVFLRGTDLVMRNQVGKALLETPKEDKPRFLARLLEGQDYTFVFLPSALRLMFSKLSIEGSMTSSQAVAPVFSAFLDRYVHLNPEHAHKRESLHLLCYALLLLSIDQFNPHVKFKMTKREFSRNNRSVLEMEHYDLAYLDRLYTNVCSLGPIAQPRKLLSAGDALSSLT
jgi:hypothetical protein